MACSLVVTACASATSTPINMDEPLQPPACTSTGHRELLDIRYAEPVGVDPNLNSLDAYLPTFDEENCGPAPIVVYVHGGGWQSGDKRYSMEDKVAFFTGHGYAFVSVNYRLSPSPSDLDDPNAIRHPIHSNDVADAIAFVVNHAGDHGADVNDITLIGHSAGAHLVSLIGTNGEFLESVGLGLDRIRCVIPLDTAAWTISERISDVERDLFLNAFGTDPAGWDDASPTSHITSGIHIPDFAIVVQGGPVRVGLSNHAAELLRDAGSGVRVLDASPLDHGDVNRAVGADEVVTPFIESALESCGRGEWG